ncbi:hypothetical protein ES703_16503 [subsurface metagenome]
MTENEQSQVYLYKIVDVTENSGIQVDYRSRWSGKDGRGVLDSRHLNFDEFAKNLLPRLKEEIQVINGLPIKYIGEQSQMRLFQLTVEGRVVRLYEPLSGEELRELQRKVLEKTVTEEAKASS